ncbi:hypothetical protein D3C85_1797980 [compost metagenome]
MASADTPGSKRHSSPPVAASIARPMPIAVHISRLSPTLRGVFSGEYLPSAASDGRSPVLNSHARSSWLTLSGVIWSSGE